MSLVGACRWQSLGGVVLSFLVVTSVSAGAVSLGQRVVVRVVPGVSVEDQPIHIKAAGLPPQSLVSVGLASVDAEGTRWVSSARFRVDARGELDLDRAAPIPAPGSSGIWAPGTYTGVWGMGLLASMRPTKPSRAGAYFWSGSRSLAFTLTVRSRGKTLASTDFSKRFAQQKIRFQHESLRTEGFFGDYWAPVGGGRHPAILAFGGSDGGEHAYLAAALFAAHGYPTLALAYWKEPGLPQTLSNIPLEYFAKALRWLRTQPHVDPNRVITLGASRGTEAALLLGVHFPNLVHGVTASVPSNVSLCSFPRCAGPTWTFAGKPLPYTRQFDNTQPTDDPSAIIPVEHIQGPIFLDCGGLDEVWESCAFAHAIIHRLDQHHDPYPHTLSSFPKAGHLIATLLPYEPGWMSIDPAIYAQANEHAREQLWPRLLRFLDALGR
jgi:dienelactone hydrolase